VGAFLRRTFPIVLAVAGIIFSVRTGGRAVEVAKDLVKAVMTRTEIETIARTLSTTSSERAASRMLRDDDRWARFLRDEALTSRGGRDTALDLWDTPFELVREGRDTWRVRSLGANLAQDFACEGAEGSGLGDPDTLLARLGWKTDAIAETTDGDTIIGDDDLCADVAFTGKASTRGDRLDRLFQ